MPDNTTWPEDAPDPHEHAYMLCEHDDSDEWCKVRIQQKHGHEPGHVVLHLGRKYVGPIGEKTP